jgi:hypothetical protein
VLIDPGLAHWIETSAGPVDRDWLVLGSAPEPTVPRGLAEGCLLACVNNSGLTAHRLGLKTPDLAVRAEHKSWSEIAGLSTHAILWISERPMLRLRMKYPASFRHRADAIRRLPSPLRDAIMAKILGLTIEPGGTGQRPSNGVFTVALALAAGAPRVIVCGVSLSENGHSYNALGEARKQIEPDRRAFMALASRYPNVVTTEPDLARDTGLGLCT